MKKLQDSLLAKIAAWVILTACVIGISCFAYLIFFNWNQCKNITKISDFWEYSYTESREFSDDVNVRLQQLTDYLKLKEILETDGELDYNKTVAILYDFDGTKSYTIGDLVKYNAMDYGFYPEDVMPELLTNIENDETLMHQRVYPILIQKDEKVVVGGESKQEKFIADFTKEENLIFVNLEEACRYYQTLWNQQGTESKEVTVNLLSNVAFYMTYYVAFYREYKAIFESDTFLKRDLLYWISAGNGQVITNIPTSLSDANQSNKANLQIAFSDANQQNKNSQTALLDANHSEKADSQESLLIEDLTGRKKYFYSSMGEIWYQTENQLMDATMRADRGIIAELEELFLDRSGGMVSIYLVVPETDTGFFYMRKENLEYAYHSSLNYIGWIFGLGILGIFSIYFLCYSAGHRSGYEGIYRNWFDCWYTEIASGICMGFGVLFCIFALDSFDRWSSFNYFLFSKDGIYFLLSCLGLYIVTLISFSSLIRRIKAGSIWKGSFTFQIFRYMRHQVKSMTAAFLQIWENRGAGKKILFVYLCMLLGNFAVVVVTSLFFKAVAYGQLGMAIPCFCMMLAIFIADFKILCWLIQKRADLAKIYKGAERISSGEWNYKLDETAFWGILQEMAKAVNRIGDGLSSAIEQSIRDERMKTDLITNVSHDIKTPLTSIINYVDLLKREQLENEKVLSYLEVLDQKSQRLKQLIDDLIEASKLSSKTVILSMEKIDLVELVRQTNGEFAERFTGKNLTILSALPEKTVFILADGKGMWRVLENLYINVAKYAMEHTRVYISIAEKNGKVEFSIKNISDSPLNIDASELTERFIRGDLSRSTEGSGLGLSIAKSLTELMDGTFEVYLDGDLFRVTMVFGIWA